VIEAFLPQRLAGPRLSIELDLLMLVITGGRERTRLQLAELFAAVGFCVHHVISVVASFAIIDARASSALEG
jgi:hypothetical protein